MKNSFSPIQIVQEDGFPIMEVGNWAQKKYKLVGKYCDIFTRAMHNKWDLIYLEKADVAFFFKQWGGKNKKKYGRVLNGRTYYEMPEIELQQSI